MERLKAEYVITRHSCTHTTSCKTTFVLSCKQYKHACIQLRSDTTQEWWAITPSSMEKLAISQTSKFQETHSPKAITCSSRTIKTKLCC